MKFRHPGVALAGALIAGVAAAQTVPVPPGGFPTITPHPTSTPREFKVLPLILVRPVLAFTGTYKFTKDGVTYRTYKYDITNKAAYPSVLFTPAPTLPPCGSNANASRAWIDVFAAGNNKRLYGFCGLDGNKDLGNLSFTLPVTQEPPPGGVYVTLTDRQSGNMVTSNTAPTNNAPPPPPIG